MISAKSLTDRQVNAKTDTESDETSSDDEPYNSIIDTCALTKFEGGLQSLHEEEDEKIQYSLKWNELLEIPSILLKELIIADKILLSSLIWS